MLVDTEVTDIPPALISKGKGEFHFSHLCVQTWTEEQTGAVQPAGMLKAAGKPGKNLKPANLKTATLDGCLVLQSTTENFQILWPFSSCQCAEMPGEGREQGTPPAQLVQMVLAAVGFPLLSPFPKQLPDPLIQEHPQG